MRRELCVLAIALAATVVQAQSGGTTDPDWREMEAPAPPPLHTSNLVALDLPGSLQFGIDPASIAIGADRIVRYVVVATSSTGAVNGIYEGLDCERGLVRVYARHNPTTGWVKSASEWKSLRESFATRHSDYLARNGACLGRAPNVSAAQIERELKAARLPYRPSGS